MKPAFIVYNFMHIRIGNFVRTANKLNDIMYHVEALYYPLNSRYLLEEVFIIGKKYSRFSDYPNSFFEEYSTENERFILNIFDIFEITLALPFGNPSNSIRINSTP